MNVTASVDGTGTINLQCDAVPLATRYRWRTLLVGVQTTAPMARIRDVLHEQTVQSSCRR